MPQIQGILAFALRCKPPIFRQSRLGWPFRPQNPAELAQILTFMAILEIARMGHPVLKNRAQDVGKFDDPDLHGFIEDMKETMVHAGGVGLAAPQVFVPLRIVIFFVPETRNNGAAVPLTVMINPVIKPVSESMSEDWEGCLSVPGLTGVVPRWDKIKYSFQDPEGTLKERTAEGFHARVVQHECDHLDGILYPMRMIDIGTLAFVDAEDDDEDLEEDEFDDADDEMGGDRETIHPPKDEPAL
jgi:peptide deformylase